MKRRREEEASETRGEGPIKIARTNTGWVSNVEWDENLLPPEIVAIIITQATGNGNQTEDDNPTIVACRWVCKWWRPFVTSPKRCVLKPLSSHFILIAARLGWMSFLKWWATDKGCITTKHLPPPVGLAAAEGGQLEVFKWLREMGFVSSSTRSELVSAVKGGNVELFELAMKEHEWIDVRNEISSLVEVAADCGHMDMVKWLFDKADENQHSLYLDSAFQGAVRSGNLGLMKLIASKDDEKDHPTIDYDTFKVAAASAKGHLDAIRWLIEERNSCFESNSIEKAAKRGHLEIIKYLHNRTKSNDDEATEIDDADLWGEAFAKAANKGHLDILKYMREEGCGWDGWSIDDNVLSKGHIEIFKWAIEGGCPYKVGVEVVCRMADAKQREETLRVLEWALREGGCAWEMDNYLTAIRFNRVDVLRWLGQHGYAWGSSPADVSSLHLPLEAVRHDSWDALKWLIQESDFPPYHSIHNNDNIHHPNNIAHLCWGIAMKGNLEMLQWVTESALWGVALGWSEERGRQILDGIMGGKTTTDETKADMLCWALTDGCPYDFSELVHYGIQLNSLDLLNWLKEKEEEKEKEGNSKKSEDEKDNRLSWSLDVYVTIAMHQNEKLLRWVRENGTSLWTLNDVLQVLAKKIKDLAPFCFLEQNWDP